MYHYTFVLQGSVGDAEGGTFVFASNVLCIWNSLRMQILMHVRTLLCSSIAAESDRYPASSGTRCILTCWAGISAVSFSRNMASTCALSTVLTTKPSPACSGGRCTWSSQTCYDDSGTRNACMQPDKCLRSLLGGTWACLRVRLYRSIFCDLFCLHPVRSSLRSCTRQRWACTFKIQSKY